MLLKEREVGGESTTLPRSKLPRVTADFAAMNRTPSKPPTYISVVQRQQELPQQEQQHEEPPPSPHIELLRITADNINHLKQLNRTIFPVSYNEKFYKDVVEFHPPELCRIACIPPASTSSTAVAGNHHLHFSLRNLFQHHNHHTNSHYHNGSSTSSSPSSRFFNLASSTSSSGGGGGGPLRNGLMRIGHPIQQPLASSSLPSTSSSSSSLTTSSTIASNSQFVIVGAICCRKETLLEPHSVISDFACHQGMASRVYIMTIGVLDPYRRLRIGSVLLTRIINYCKTDPNIYRIVLHVHVSNQDAIKFYRKHGFIIAETVEGYYLRNKGVEPPDAYLLKLEIRNIPNHLKSI